jgi:hypothetical protein
LTRALVFGITDKIQEDLLQEFSPDLKRFGHGIWRKVRYTLRRSSKGKNPLSNSPSNIDTGLMSAQPKVPATVGPA